MHGIKSSEATLKTITQHDLCPCRQDVEPEECAFMVQAAGWVRRKYVNPDDELKGPDGFLLEHPVRRIQLGDFYSDYQHARRLYNERIALCLSCPSSRVNQ